MTITTRVTVGREEREAIKAFDELCKKTKFWVCYAEDMGCSRTKITNIT